MKLTTKIILGISVVLMLSVVIIIRSIVFSEDNYSQGKSRIDIKCPEIKVLVLRSNEGDKACFKQVSYIDLNVVELEDSLPSRLNVSDDFTSSYSVVGDTVFIDVKQKDVKDVSLYLQPNSDIKIISDKKIYNNYKLSISVLGNSEYNNVDIDCYGCFRVCVFESKINSLRINNPRSVSLYAKEEINNFEFIAGDRFNNFDFTYGKIKEYDITGEYAPYVVNLIDMRNRMYNR